MKKSLVLILLIFLLLGCNSNKKTQPGGTYVCVSSNIARPLYFEFNKDHSYVYLEESDKNEVTLDNNGNQTYSIASDSEHTLVIRYNSDNDSFQFIDDYYKDLDATCTYEK